MKTLIFSFLVMFAAGCSCTKNSTSQNLMINDIWVLQSLEGENISKSEFPNEFPRLEFYDSEKRITGFTGCNNLSGTYKTNNNEISFSPLMTTKMFCQGVKENEFLQAMNGINKYKIENLKLYLYKDENLKLIFKKDD